jgi:solute carrier family 35, member E3
MAMYSSHPYFKPLVYGLLNIVSASGIVFANKTVFAVYGFKFTACLTLIHTVVTLFGMHAFSYIGLFQVKQLPQIKLLPLAASYVAYIVLCNLSLNVNTVSFYQIMKIAVAPTVLVIEACFYQKYPSFKVVAAVCVVCLGIAAATVTDTQMVNNVHGLLVGCAATLVTALYQIWAGTKQKELKAGSMQLLHQYTPQAALLLGLLVLVMEPVTPSEAHPQAILNYNYTTMAIVAILVSSLLGLLVSLSTFLVIAATSSLTYNIVGQAYSFVPVGCRSLTLVHFVGT